MEHIVNQIILTGNLAGAPRYSHENHGRRFYAFPLEVERLSGTTDTLRCSRRWSFWSRRPRQAGIRCV